MRDVDLIVVLIALGSLMAAGRQSQPYQGDRGDESDCPPFRLHGPEPEWAPPDTDDVRTLSLEEVRHLQFMKYLWENGKVAS